MGVKERGVGVAEFKLGFALFGSRRWSLLAELIQPNAPNRRYRSMGRDVRREDVCLWSHNEENRTTRFVASTEGKVR
jgi:hypothetical protein